MISLSEYQSDPWLQQAILSMKHGGRTQFSRGLGYLLARKIEHEFSDETWHGVTAVPLHFTRRWKRGYNQADIVAGALGRTLGITSYNWLLKRNRRTSPQSGGPRKRQENVRGAFQIGGSCVGGRIILVDDVFTTGATAMECARMLCQAGAKHVLIATCAWVKKAR